MKHILLLTFATASLIAADATGRWSGTLTPPDGGQHPALLVLKQDGVKLTGTAGPDANEQIPIKNGKAENGSLTFEISKDDVIMRFTLKHDGDEIKGDITRERTGEKETATLSVKRL